MPISHRRHGQDKTVLSCPCRRCETGINAHKHKHYTVSQNDTDVAQYSFDGDQPILINFGRDVAGRVCYQMAICYPTSPN